MNGIGSGRVFIFGSKTPVGHWNTLLNVQQADKKIKPG
jgi:hypothetical protein